MKIGILVVVIIAFVFFALVVTTTLGCTAVPTQIYYSISLLLTHYVGGYYYGYRYSFAPLSIIPGAIWGRCF